MSFKNTCFESKCRPPTVDIEECTVSQVLLCSGVVPFKNTCESNCRPHTVDLAECNVSQADIVSGDLAKCFDLAGRRSIHGVILTHGTFNYLPDGTFDGMTSLYHLFLSLGDLEWISEDTFQGVPNLSVLSLRDNRLRYLPRGVFRNTRGLKYLEISGNNFTELPSGIFKDLESLPFLTWDDPIRLNRGDFSDAAGPFIVCNMLHVMVDLSKFLSVLGVLCTLLLVCILPVALFIGLLTFTPLILRGVFYSVYVMVYLLFKLLVNLMAIAYHR